MISPIFVGHGSPMMAIQDTACTEFLLDYGKTQSHCYFHGSLGNRGPYDLIHRRCLRNHL